MTFELLSGNKWLRRTLYVLVGALLLWGLAWLALPYIVKSQAEKQGTEKLGRQVQVGHVDFHPWTLALTLDNVSIAAASGTVPQLQVQRIVVDAALWQSLRRLAPVVDGIAIDQPVLKITHQGDGHYDFDDVLARLSSPSEPTPSPTPAFALYNITLTGGAVDFVDQPVGATHALRDLHLGLPFISNLDSQREIKAEPRLAFTLNGSHFDSAAQTTPFAVSRKTDASFQLKNMDLAPYLPYLPASLPVKLQAAVLNADLQLAFEQTPKLSLRISGVLQADKIKLANPQGAGWLALDTLKLTVDALRPLEQTVKLSAVELAAPALDLRRDAAGRLNLASAPVASKTIAAPAAAASASGTKDAQPAGWKVSVDKLALHSGSLRWTDASTQPAAQVAVQQLALEASAIAWPFTQPLQFKGSAQIAGDAATSSELRFSGSATDQQAQVDAQLGGLPLAVAAPYLASVLEPRLTGQLSADLQLQWKAPDALQLSAKQLTLDNLALGATALATNKKSSQPSDAKAAKPEMAALASLRQLQISQAQVDLAQRRVQIGKLSLTEPRAKVARGKDQRWMYEAWLKPAPASSAASTAAPTTPTQPWAVSVADLQLDGGAVSYLDQANADPVAFEVTALQLQMKDLVPGSAKASPLSVSARIGAGNAEPGRLTYKGTLALQPLAAQGQLDLVHLPLHAFEPYFGASLNVDVVRADTSFKGQLAYTASPAGPVLQVRGDGTLEDLRANRSANSTMAGPTTSADGPPAPTVGRELLSWKLLNLRGLDVALKPGTATRVDIKETALSDFYARIVVDETGRINLQDLVKSSTPPPTPAADATNKVAAPAVATSASAPNPSNEPGAVVRMGGISLVNGRVLFSDRFVKPNYSANLSELTGKLGAFSSVPAQGQVQLADLELRGRAEGTASLEILGKLNPLAKPLALDIGAKVRDLELPALSPYSIRYVGHGIERGKMSVDVHYTVQPDGQLTATNSIILNQLTFGDEVAGAPTSLPVKLAVALLADSNGVIDLNLPLSGSLNDPQFRIGPVIWKILGNLIAKAITSPFSLLAHAFGGGGEELGSVPFAPGSAVLTADARQGLDKVAKVLTDRPALKMTVVGNASLEVEREAMQRQRLQRRVLAEKRRNLVTGGAAAANADAAELEGITVSDAEYPALLKSVYQRASFPKPRNALGLLKDLPQPEMEQLLLANLPVDEDNVQRLAVQRGVAVRDYLAAQKLPLERLFLGAAKTTAGDANWRPQADLQLATP
ncbi:protein of unknown function [Rhodoferax sp. OV413]|uniref:DUF748 domain-containing protein n=1 Tax=Rhodoferax sp. OV413 TaxID=1855285 RepID=UPI0008882E0E|nr:protein of unknown function [Rhodoferax sp. OV413]